MLRRTLGAALLGSIALAPSLALAEPPANDNIEDAVPIEVGVELPADTREATIQEGEDHCSDERTVWYSFTAPEAGDYVTYAADSDHDTSIGWNDALDLSTGDCPDDSNDSYDAVETPIALAEGEQEYVSLAVYEAADTGLSTVGVARVGSGADNLADATPLSFATANAPSAVAAVAIPSDASTEDDEPSACGNDTFNTQSVWLDFVAPSSGTWFLSAKSEDSVDLSIYQGSAMNELQLIHCSTSDRRAVLADLNEGETYRVRVAVAPFDAPTFPEAPLPRPVPARLADGSSVVVLRAKKAAVPLAPMAISGETAASESNGDLELITVNGQPTTFTVNGDAGDLRALTLGPDGTWTEATLPRPAEASGSVEEFRAITMPTGRAGVAYRDGGDGSIRFAEQLADGSWSDVLVDGDDFLAGNFVDVALVSGQPAVMLFDEDAEATILARRDDTGTWTSETVAVTPDLNVRVGALAVSADDTPVLAFGRFVLDPGGTTRSLRVTTATPDGDAWAMTPVGLSLAVDSFELEISPAGTPTIAALPSLMSSYHLITPGLPGEDWVIEDMQGGRSLAQHAFGCSAPHLSFPDEKTRVVWMDCNYSGSLAVSERNAEGQWTTHDLVAYFENPTSPDFPGSVTAWSSEQFGFTELPNGDIAIAAANDDGRLFYAAEALIAEAGEDIDFRTTESGMLDASGSTDGFGSIANYQWSAPTDCTLTEPNAALTGISCVRAGSYSVQLAVTDTDGFVDRDSVTIDVVDPRPADDRIARLYQAAFGRTPDGAGFEYWASEHRLGAAFEDIANAFVMSDEFAQRFGTDLSDAGFVDALYNNVLGRDGDAAGRSFWQARLEAGAERAQVLAAFADSPENIERTSTVNPLSSPEAEVLRLYRAAFGRFPDADGFAFWVGERSNGASLESIAADFALASEFERRYGAALDDRQFLDVLYQNVLERPGDAGGIEFWLAVLDDGATRADVLLAFSESPENLIRTGTAK